jgi:hypothetical protein
MILKTIILGQLVLFCSASSAWVVFEKGVDRAKAGSAKAVLISALKCSPKQERPNSDRVKAARKCLESHLSPNFSETAKDRLVEWIFFEAHRVTSISRCPKGKEKSLKETFPGPFEFLCFKSVNPHQERQAFFSFERIKKRLLIREWKAF